MKCLKSGAIIINEGFIRKNIMTNDNNYTYEYIYANRNEIDIKKLFYKYYINWKLYNNEKFMKSSKWKGACNSKDVQ